MGRRYVQIKQYYELIMQLDNEDKSYREIGEELEFTRLQIKEYVRRLKRLAQKQAQSVPKPKDRPPE